MKYTFDPKRLADVVEAGEVAKLGAAVRALRDQHTSAAEVESLARRMAPQLASHAAVGAAGGVVLGASMKWIATLLLAVAVGSYAVVQRSGRGGETVRQQAIASAPPRASEPLVHASEPSPASVAPAPPPAVVAAVSARSVVAPASALGTKHRRPQPALPSDTPQRLSNAAPDAELALLRQAQSALDRDPNAALALAQQHTHAYPYGLFAQEREILAIEALLKLRRRLAAMTRAAEFVQRYPDSPHARRVRSLLERSTVASQPTTVPASDHSSTGTQQ